jgi:hypothetical protein
MESTESKTLPFLSNPLKKEDMCGKVLDEIYRLVKESVGDKVLPQCKEGVPSSATIVFIFANYILAQAWMIKSSKDGSDPKVQKALLQKKISEKEEVFTEDFQVFQDLDKGDDTARATATEQTNTAADNTLIEALVKDLLPRKTAEAKAEVGTTVSEINVGDIKGLINGLPFDTVDHYITEFKLRDIVDNDKVKDILRYSDIKKKRVH